MTIQCICILSGINFSLNQWTNTRTHSSYVSENKTRVLCLLHSQWDCRLYNICCSAIRAVIPFPTHTAITHASLLLLLLWSFRALGKLNPRQRIRSKGNEVKCWAVNGTYTHSLVGWYIGNQCPSASATAEAEATSCCLDIKTPSEGAARPVFVPFPDGNLTP